MVEVYNRACLAPCAIEVYSFDLLVPRCIFLLNVLSIYRASFSRHLPDPLLSFYRPSELLLLQRSCFSVVCYLQVISSSSSSRIAPNHQRDHVADLPSTTPEVRNCSRMQSPTQRRLSSLPALD